MQKNTIKTSWATSSSHSDMFNFENRGKLFIQFTKHLCTHWYYIKTKFMHIESCSLVNIEIDNLYRGVFMHNNSVSVTKARLMLPHEL